MEIWLIKTGEPLPLADKPTSQLLRTGMLANQLAERGHEVTWWTAKFDHFKKRPHPISGTSYEVRPNYRIRLLRGNEYKRNASFSRWLHHRRIAHDLFHEAQKARRPDVIVCAFPTVEFAEVSLRLSTQWNVPLIIDIRDLWPDIYKEMLPKFCGPLLEPLIAITNRKVKRVFTKTSGIISITEDILKWGLDKAYLTKRENDAVFHLAPETTVASTADPGGEDYWREKGIEKNDFLLVYSGALSKKIDLSAIFAAAQHFRGSDPRVKFVFCGLGDEKHAFESQARDLPNVSFPGWVDGVQKSSLFKMAKVGLLPLKPRIDYSKSIPNKAVEYWTEGLPLLSCLDGNVKNLVESQSVGRFYPLAGEKNLISAITEYKEDDRLWHQHSQNAKALAEARFNAPTILSSMANYIERVSSLGH